MKFDPSQFWFIDFIPDVDIVINNNSVLSLVKKTIMESSLGLKKRAVVFDPLISKILQAELYYVGLGKKKQLISHINKSCNLTVDPYTLNLQIEIENEGKFIFVECSVHEDLMVNCCLVQEFYDIRTKYLKSNKYRTIGKFIQNVHYPIHTEIKYFLKNKAQVYLKREKKLKNELI